MSPETKRRAAEIAAALPPLTAEQKARVAQLLRRPPVIAKRAA